MNQNNKEFNYQDESASSRKNWQIGSTDLKEVKQAYEVGEPYQTNSYGGANIDQPSLSEAEQEYNVGKVGYHNGVSTNISTMTADTTNSDTNTLDTTASEENRSAKYKNPNVKQDTSQMPPSNGQEPRI